MDTTLILITLLSLVVAGAMSLVAWRAIVGERRRSSARVAALAAEIGEDASPVRPVDAFQERAAGILSTEAKTTPSRMPIAVATGGLIVGTGIGLVIVLSSSLRPAASTTTPAPAAATRASAPIELVALDHQRESKGLVVRGLVHNPLNGKDVSRLTAVVLLLDAGGALVATGQSAVAGDLRPGADTRFTVTVPGAGEAARYRVSFKTDDRVIPHVDKRDGL